MKKQILSLLLIAVMMAMLLPTVAFADYYGTQWVYTDNGKSLNVRSTPSTGNNIIGSLKYGAEVTVVEMYSNGWAQILWQQNPDPVAAECLRRIWRGVRAAAVPGES